MGSDQLVVLTYIEDNDSLCYLPFPDTALCFFPYFLCFLYMNVHVSRFFFFKKYTNRIYIKQCLTKKGTSVLYNRCQTKRKQTKKLINRTISIETVFAAINVI